ncbi:hypothetical protein D3C79_798440 [compost metagenome]
MGFHQLDRLRYRDRNGVSHRLVIFRVLSSTTWSELRMENIASRFIGHRLTMHVANELKGSVRSRCPSTTGDSVLVENIQVLDDGHFGVQLDQRVDVLVMPGRSLAVQQASFCQEKRPRVERSQDASLTGPVSEQP